MIDELTVDEDLAKVEQLDEFLARPNVAGARISADDWLVFYLWCWAWFLVESVWQIAVAKGRLGP